ncbi:MAG TPA: dihydropteroate synthase, partial [Thermoplasmata archaeon]|nr:dihydropteroate synthase [Thermoplasmata archaeon]
MSEPSPGEASARAARYHPRVLEASDAREIARELERTGCEPEGVGIMTRKGRTVLLRLDHISLKAAPLLKQELLAVGADSAHARGIADHSVTETEAVLLATPGQYRRVVDKLLRQPFHLKEVAHAIEEALAHYGSHRLPVVKGLHRPIRLGDGTGVLGVVNVTPASFSDGGQFLAPARARARAQEIAAQGARMVDLGAESTRPGAEELSAEKEWARLGPVLGPLHAVSTIPISVDTRHAE